MNTNHPGAPRKAWLTYFGLAQAIFSVFAVASACSTSTPGGTTFSTGGSAQSTGGATMMGTGGGPVTGGAPATGGNGPITVGTAGASSTEKCLTSCTQVGGQWCGEVGNNCGGIFKCAPCPNDWVCQNNLCIGPPSCQRLTCDAVGGRYCGTIGDGCGGGLDCGACPDGGECGGGGIANLCKPANCTPRVCTDPTSGGQYCGDIGDGCGGLLHCGDCAGGKACGGDGVPNVCQGAGCKNFQCKIKEDACATGSETTLSGTVYDPAGKLPLYNALVYIPNDALPLPPIADGITCEPCAAFAAGSPIASALSDVSGKFTLKNVPSGSNIPLVIQVGKWRREVVLNTTINKCTTNELTDVNLTRLPRKKSEGHIPRIALTTGGQDALECLLRRIGIADEEFTTDTGEGRVHLYTGGNNGQGAGADQFSPQLGGAKFSQATTLWSDPAKLHGYDIMMMSCEGGEYANAKMPNVNNVATYMNQGGRVFAGHYHYYWMRSGPADLRATATYAGTLPDPPTLVTATVETGFMKGAALADWLVLTGASTTRGELPLAISQHSVTAVTPPTQSWISLASNPNDNQNRPSVQYMTFNTPTASAPEAQCGRVVFTDIHIAASVADPAGGGNLGGDSSKPGAAAGTGTGTATGTGTGMGGGGAPPTPFPTGCQMNGMSPQAKALEFMFFDLSACVTPPDVPPVPPPPGVPPPANTPPPPPPPPPPPAK